ncbi:OmpA family protein [Vibrio cincinnatiensis]|uniref:OmpA family protein n=1 Tax=Vibrio cincinnatiensis TaxID=675 RepID=UPI001EE0DD28|nr:OmpA family protein [Vibrio cincinnatiensis]MCG3733106.1 OmpA family protein [Vibrio cincinnatiensis]MCG3739896.1 OmpA family protein [Vibrio cincinnatiensis]
MKRIMFFLIVAFSLPICAKENSLFKFYCMKEGQEIEYSVTSRYVYEISQLNGNLSVGSQGFVDSNVMELHNKINALKLPSECTSYFLSRSYWEADKPIARGHFNFNRSDMTSEGLKALALISQELVFNEKINLIGHADSIGSDKYNMNLSSKRVDSVEKSLNGLGHHSLYTEHHGKRKPVASNQNSYGRSVNRRFEVFHSE